MSKMKVFSIFLSSSFFDMQEERDYLRKTVFRNLDAELIRKNARLRVIDLRGSEKNMTGEEISKEEAVLWMCLQGVDACRPRLIGLLGDRYGWVPYGQNAKYPDEATKSRIQFAVSQMDQNKKMPITKEEIADISVTHLEIKYGMKNVTTSNTQKEKNTNISTEDCYFYIRTIDNLCEMPSEILTKFTEGKECQDTLKTWITDQMGASQKKHITFYHAGWDLESQCISKDSLVTLGQVMYDQLKQSIFNELDSVQLQDESEMETQIFLNAKRDNTIPRAEIQALTDFALNESGAALLVTGAGVGKSTLMAQTQEILEKKENEGILWLITHIGGIDSESNTLIGVMRHCCVQLERKLGILHEEMGESNNDELNEEIPSEQSQEQKQLFELWKDRLAELLFSSCLKHRIVILLDSADSLEKTEDSRWFHWLPSRLPTDCRVIISSLPETMFLPAWEENQVLVIKGIPEEDIREMLLSIAETQYGKGWNQEILGKATDKIKEAECMPLYAQILVSHLMNISGKDFKLFQTAQGHIDWMRYEIEKAPITIDGLYGVLVHRVQEEFGQEIGDAVMGLIAVSRNGLYEDDLIHSVQQLTGKHVGDLNLLNIRGLLMGHLRQDMEQSWWDFEHQQMRRCLLEGEQRLISEAYEKKLHRTLALSAIETGTESGNIYGEFWGREFLWHAYKGEVIIETAEWLSKLPSTAETVAKNTIVEVLNDEKETGIDWLKNSIDKFSEFQDMREYRFFLKSFGSEIRFPQFDYSYTGKIFLALHESMRRRMELLGVTEEGSSILSWTSNLMGSFYRTGGDRPEAEKWYHKAEELRKRLLDTEPENSNYLDDYGNTCNSLGLFYKTGWEREKAEEWYMKAEKSRRYLCEMHPENLEYIISYSKTCNNLGIFFKTGDIRDKAEYWYLKAEKLKYELLNKNLENTKYLFIYGITCQCLGTFYKTGGDRENELIWYEKAEEIKRKLHEAHPKNLNYLYSYGLICHLIARYYRDGKQYQEAEKWYQNAERIKRQAFEEHPENAGCVGSYGVTCNGLAKYFSIIGVRTEAEKWFCQAVKIKHQLYKVHPENLAYIRSYGTICNEFGKFISEGDTRENAEEWYLLAGSLKLKVYEIQPENTKNKKNYKDFCTRIRDFYISIEQLKKAEVWNKKVDDLEGKVASVMNELEEADEDIEKISSSSIEKYIEALSKNIEI